MPISFGSRKQLKRVGGDVQLAAIKNDPQRPPTSGGPLKRCSNNAHINLLQDSSITTLDSTVPEERYTTPSFAGSNVTFSNNIRHENIGGGHSSANTPTKYRFSAPMSDNFLLVPNNSTQSTPKTKSFNFSNGIKASLQETRLKYKAYNKENELPRTRDLFTVDDNCSSIGPTLSKFQSLTETGKAATPQITVERMPNPVEQVIQTATSLGLQESNRALSSRPSNWSLKNEVATPKSPIVSSTTLKTDSKEGKNVASISTLPISRYTGDGDSASISGNSGSKKEADSLMPRAPPPSAATTLRDGTPFKFTFRKPKIRPRSIITNVSGSARASLPTTASTPNPIMPQTPFEQVREEPNSNTNNNNDINNNNNNYISIVQEEEPQEVNNNVVDVPNEKDNETPPLKPKSSKGKVPSAVLALEKEGVKGKEYQVMPGEVEPAGVEPATGFYEVDKADEDFWNSDSTPLTPESEQHHHPDDPRDSKDKKKESSEISKEISKSKSSSAYDVSKTSPVSEGSRKPRHSQTTKDGSAYGRGGGLPFLTTDKGAIRFHLPGRIQHKTTIKVAHFPTGDEKKVVVNLKPDEDEEVCIGPPNCANNQNFVIQPPQPSYPPAPGSYNCYPYGYGYGAPNYYGYGGCGYIINY